MINKIFTYIKGLGTKSLIILIALSFAFWGVGDIFTSNKNPVIAKVGNNKVKLNEFNLEYQSILQRLRATSNEPITDEFVKAMGLQNTVLNNLINQKYLNIISSELGIIISDSYLKKSIINNPMFKDQLGVFNKDYFTYYLNQNNLSEKELLEISKKVLINDVFIQSLDSASFVPETMTNNFLKKKNVARKADVFYFDSTTILIKEKITDKMLNEKYEKYKNNFLTPETREFTLVQIDQDKIKKDIKISTEEVEKVYKVNKDNYQIKEIREVYQPIFKTIEEATDFKEKTIKNGFLNTLKYFKIKKETINLGKVKKNDLDEFNANIVFNLKEQSISDVYEDSFGFKLYYVMQIQEKSQLTTADIKKMIKSDLAREVLFNKTYEQADRLFEEFIEHNNINKVTLNKDLKLKNHSSIFLIYAKAVAFSPFAAASALKRLFNFA
jgi:peptidyl-prolyl cis-trans isomerase D